MEDFFQILWPSQNIRTLRTDTFWVEWPSWVTKHDSLLPEDKCQIAESRSEGFF